MEMEAEEGGEARCHVLVVVCCRLSFVIAVGCCVSSRLCYHIIRVGRSITPNNYLCIVVRYCISGACEGVASRVFFVNRVPTSTYEKYPRSSSTTK